ncbi:MAG: hypothetical protein COB81_00270 [Flavobacteriaceae bacterium]|nr:MAG: hypothetical protein COB81_00270 [Flavobacteriaceae bacterium]
MRKLAVLYTLIILLTACNKEKKEIYPTLLAPLELTTDHANFLYHFAYDCVDQEYPNKLGQVLENATDLKEPSTLHPAFYGCFDWHSAVHGHWTLINIIKELPNFEHREAILKKLQASLTKENILKEVAYFDATSAKNFERTYGWAWLLKVAEVLDDWEAPEAKTMAKNLQPLVSLIENKYLEFLPKLSYPIRVGEHANTAFGLSFALDYARKHNPALEAMIIAKAKEYYLNDENCPISWEPGGFDFLSPCLQEAALMQKVLSKEEFTPWLDAFLPGFRENPSTFLHIVKVTDRSDGKLAHLDGLNYSRAWCLFQIGKGLNNDQMIALGRQHFNHSYKKMDSGEYAGAHWLASFALYALLED